MASSMAHMAAAIHTTTTTTTTAADNATTSSSQQPQFQQQQQQQPLASNSSLVDASDSSQEIKSEFYTREGLWSLVSNTGEYARQLINSQQQQFQPQQSATMTSGLAGPTQMSQPNLNGPNVNGSPVVVNVSQMQSQTSTPNELVQSKLFRFSKRLLVQDTFLNGAELENLPYASTRLATKTRLCSKCLAKTTKPTTESTTRKPTLEYDDDDDVVVTKLAHTAAVKFTLNEAGNCPQCGTSTDDLNDDDEEIFNESETAATKSSPHLDVLVFNYSKEIYMYEFNQLPPPPPNRPSAKSPTSPAMSQKNLIDKKVYKTYMSSCLDVNYMASAVNTRALQLLANANTTTSTQQSPSIIMSPVTAGLSPNVTPTKRSAASSAPRDVLDASFRFSITPTNLSLIVAAGFAKGEIHVFDVFKKDASVFFNNSKLVDKTKVTCIKWVPNSVNLFLAGYSSGNIYLYDANHQAQSTVAPTYSKHIHTDAYSVLLNIHSSSTNNTDSSSSSSPTTAAGSNQTASNNAASSKQLVNNTHNNSYISSSTSQLQQKNPSQLTLSNIHQPVQVAKNPLLRIKIGPCPAGQLPQTLQQTPDSASDLNGVNDFAFSPCGHYLAVVSQDGYLRVFSFTYDPVSSSSSSSSTSGLGIQLRCSMKSYFGGLLCVCWSHDGRYVATGGEDDLITVFAFADGMRVACRGRGHSSWINVVAFDPWTTLPNYSAASSTTTGHSKSDRKEGELSDLEDNPGEEKQQVRGIGSKHHSSGPKQRTISTLSDYSNLNSSSPRNETRSKSLANSGETEPAVYYRLASVGQDNQVCFWDLTDDVLRERPAPAVSAGSNHYRSRGVSTATVATAGSGHSSTATTTTTATLSSNTNTTSPASQSSGSSSNKHSSSSKLGHHHSTASSLVSTARNLFSKQKTEQIVANNNEAGEETSSSSSIIKTSSLSTGIFRKNKRVNTSGTNSGAIDPVTSTSTTSTTSSKLKHSGSGGKGSQIILNSYKKSNTETIASSNQTESTESKKLSSSTRSAADSSSTLPIAPDYGQFNQCPKLDEVPIIEPLICKRIANERLTSLVFRDDCFVVSTQDGFVYTWARPRKEPSSKSRSGTVDSKITTSL